MGERSRQRRDVQVIRAIRKSEQFQVCLAGPVLLIEIYNIELYLEITDFRAQVREESLQLSDRRAVIDDDKYVN